MNTGSGAALKVRDKGKLDSLLSKFGQAVEDLGKVVASTSIVADRLSGGGAETPNRGAPDAPARVALLGSFEDLLDRLDGITGNLRGVNARLDEAL